MAIRPVSILRRVSTGMPAARGDLGHAPLPARLTQQHAEPLAALTLLGVNGGRTIP